MFSNKYFGLPFINTKIIERAMHKIENENNDKSRKLIFVFFLIWPK